MGIGSKILEARKNIAALNLKKTAHNDFVGFDYFEYSDILPAIRDEEQKLNILSVFTFSSTLCILRLSDIDSDEEIEFSVPFIMSDLKGAQPTQNLGASITYIKRYLYCMAYQLEESKEVLDAVQGAEDRKKPIAPAGSITENQIKAIYALKVDIPSTLDYYKVTDIEELSKAQAFEIIQKAKKNEM